MVWYCSSVEKTSTGWATCQCTPRGSSTVDSPDEVSTCSVSGTALRLDPRPVGRIATATCCIVLAASVSYRGRRISLMGLPGVLMRSMEWHSWHVTSVEGISSCGIGGIGVG